MKDYIEKNLEINKTKKRGTVSNLYKDRFSLTVALINRFCRIKKPLLDIGARDGILLDELTKRGWKDVTGLDIWPEGLEIIRKKGYKTIHADIQEYTSNQKYHTIVMSHVLEHCPDPLKVLKNVNQMMPHGGFVYIEVPRQDDLRIDRAGHYYNFPEPKSLLELVDHMLWSQRYFGWCLRRIYYMGQRWNSNKRDGTLV